jgi:hypothetical protein
MELQYVRSFSSPLIPPMMNAFDDSLNGRPPFLLLPGVSLPLSFLYKLDAELLYSPPLLELSSSPSSLSLSHSPTPLPEFVYVVAVRARSPARRRRPRTPSKPRRYLPVEPLPLVDVHHSLRKNENSRLKTTQPINVFSKSCLSYFIDLMNYCCNFVIHAFDF